MKFSSTTATGTSAITVANVISKVAALAFIMSSSFGVVYGNSYTNLALGKPTNSSSTHIHYSNLLSTYVNWYSEYAVDGNTNGDYPNGGRFFTSESETDPWWEVDLQGVFEINSISVKNRADCCAERLDNFIVEVFLNDDSITYTYHHGRRGVLDETVTIEDINAVGSKVRIRREGDNIRLTLVEVEVNGSEPTWTNVALNKPATQSSTNSSAEAELAVDGNTNGDLGEFTYTQDEVDPWWEVDLQESYAINSISVKIRAAYMNDRNFIVEVFHNDDGIAYSYSHSSTGELAETVTIDNINVVGSRVRIRKQSFSLTYLSLVEVQVNGYSPRLTEIPSQVPSLTPSSVPTAAVSKTEFALAFLKNDTVIDFAGNSTDKEIIIKSLISDKALRDSFDQTIWVGPDCEFKFDEVYPNDTSLVTISNNDTLDVVEGKTKEVTSEIDIDTLNIASKGIHDNANKSIYSQYVDGTIQKAKVEFCVRTDYGKVNITTTNGTVLESSLNFYKVKIAIDFVLEFGFTSSTVTIKEEDASKTQQNAVITTKLEACDCPANANSEDDCYGTDTSSVQTYNQNDILSVCVYDPSGNSIITSFKDVDLGNGQIRTQVIDTDGRPTALASVSRLNEEMAIVNTRIVSAFFDSSDGTAPAPVNVGGTAIIGFKTSGARKLTSVGLKGARNMRKLQDEEAGGEGTFDVEVILSDEEEVDGSPGFDVLEYGIMSFVMTAMIPMVLL